MRVVTLCTEFCPDGSTAQARTLQETADQVPAQNQPEAKDQGELWSKDQDQAGDSDQDVAISFTGEERLARAADLRKTIVCTCRSGLCYSDSLNGKLSNPSYREDTQNMADHITSNIATHHSKWADAQARTLQETADQVPAQNQPEAKDQGELWSKDQDQAGDSDQDVAISFTGEERLARAADLRKPIVCTCRSGLCYSEFCPDGSTAQARTLQETADQVPAQNQPEAKDQGELWSKDQDQAGDSDQDVAISFTGEERLARAADLRKPIVCTCRSGLCYSDSLNGKLSNPSYREDTQNMADHITSNIATHHSKWADVLALLNILLMADGRHLVINKANEEPHRLHQDNPN
ncbi:hypothetical protein QTO34_016436 [Cnephaeus nilssonii]|uniref:Alpha-defensin N-terminal domain-containing protein n=1 Tax=Cnephaeus nilssonii TaxID=3371016 RepID=A0AA40I281_CNENI|nr:hypothetical protein QTO34_016436 [Eptesicus nilssonii]